VEDRELEANPGGSAAPLKPEVVYEPAIDKGVLGLYVLIALVLGAALLYSLSLGEKYLALSSSIVTALTTIAGFAVGANVAPPQLP